MVKESGVVRIERGCLRKGCWWCAKWLGGEGGDVVPLAVQMRWVAEFFEGLYYQLQRGGVTGEVTMIGLKIEEEAAYGEDPTTFPTDRRPGEFRRTLDVHTTDLTCENWFSESGITIGTHLTEEQRKATIRLLYTWKTSFVSDTKDIPVTDLVVHTIPTYAGIRAHRARDVPHTAEEEAWQLANLPPMLESIIGFTQSPWVAKTTFMGKKDSEKTRDPITGFRTSLRMVHTYCALNRATIKSNYPMKRMEPIINGLAKDSRRYYFSGDAANGYYPVPLLPKHTYKTAFNSVLGQCCYLRMGMGLLGAPHTYTKLKDMTFGRIPDPGSEPSLHEVVARINGWLKGGEVEVQSGKQRGEGVRSEDILDFRYFFNDDYEAVDDFNTLYQFLGNWYFP